MTNPVAEMMANIRGDIYERLLKNELRYETDLKTLRNFVQVALEMKDYTLAGRNMNIIGLIERSYGQIANALDAYQQAYGWFSQDQAFRFMALMQNNIAEVNRFTLNYSEALHHYQQAEEIVPQDEDQVIAIIQVNLGWVNIALKNIDAADLHLNSAFENIQKNIAHQVEVLVEIHTAMAEVYLAKDDIPNAQYNIREAIRFATQRSHHRLLAVALFARGHIEEYLTDDDKSGYYEQALQILREKVTPANQCYILLGEAYYQQQRGRQQQARQLLQALDTIPAFVSMDGIRTVAEALIEQL